MCVEWVAGSPWNQWPDVHGIGGRMAVESADNQPIHFSEHLLDSGYRAPTTPFNATSVINPIRDRE